MVSSNFVEESASETVMSGKCSRTKQRKKNEKRARNNNKKKYVNAKGKHSNRKRA